jgi:membrane protease YdiL (CAAX protease family)
MADKSPPGPPQSAPRWPTGAAGLGDGWAKASGNALDDGPTAGPGAIPARAGWWAIPGAAVGILLAGLGSTIGVAITGSSKSATTDLLGEAGLWAAMLGTAVWVSNRYGRASLRRDYGLSIKSRDLLWGALAAASALAVAQIVLVIFSNTRYAGSNDEVLTQQQGHHGGFVAVSLIVAVGAPLFEELFFRGFLRTTLQARFGAHGAVWLQAVFFGLAHLGEATTRLGNVSVVLALFGVGVVLGYTAKLTRRLGPGMVAHCLFNLVAVVSVL